MIRRKPHVHKAPNPLDLNAIVNQAMINVSHSGLIEKTVEHSIKETVSSILSSVFREYGDFGKALKKEVQEGLDINFSKLDIPSYNLLIMNMLQAEIDQGIKTEGIEKLKDLIHAATNHSEKEFKLSEIVEKIKKDARDDDEDINGEITMIIDRSFSYWIDIHIHPEEGERKYGCKYHIRLNSETKKVELVEIDQKPIDINTVISRIYGLDRELFFMFASGSVVHVDEDAVDPYYPDDFED